MKKDEDYLGTVNPAKKVREAITRMVGARLAAQEALKQLKDDSDSQHIEYEIPAQELEDIIDKCYALENGLGDVHQFIIVGLATELS